MYKVNEGIEIKINDYVMDLKNKIVAEEDNSTGTKYIKSIKVPTTAVSIYKNAAGWKDFSDRISGY